MVAPERGQVSEIEKQKRAPTQREHTMSELMQEEPSEQNENQQ